MKRLHLQHHYYYYFTMKDLISYLKNLGITIIFVFGFCSVIQAFNEAAKNNKEYDKYDSLNKRIERIKQGDGLLEPSLQDCDSIYNSFRNRRRNINF